MDAIKLIWFESKKQITSFLAIMFYIHHLSVTSLYIYCRLLSFLVL